MTAIRQQGYTLDPGYYTLNPGYYTLNPGYYTLNPGYYTLNPGYYTLNPGYYTLNPGYYTMGTIQPIARGWDSPTLREKSPEATEIASSVLPLNEAQLKADVRLAHQSLHAWCRLTKPEPGSDNIFILYLPRGEIRHRDHVFVLREEQQRCAEIMSASSTGCIVGGSTMQRTECVLDANRVQNGCVVRTFEHPSPQARSLGSSGGP
ncbi:unnamed protein product [Arctogadus glacialis]